ncbi:MAG: ATP synthase F0 subunit B, partial [Lachnospiraceae bacterium]|nr:ATP synthase F0 subunit B [Lachnospiraceae bacterium]
MLSLSAANIFYMVINLLVLYLIFHFFLFKRVDRVLDARREEVENCTKDSLAAKKEAEEMKAKYEGDRKALDAQKSQVIQDARDKGYHEYENIIA